mgnify:CR=1 FL=1
MSIYHDTLTTLELEKKASEIMESFDFESVHAHMVETGWQWYVRDIGMKVPDIEDIKTTARYLLTQAIWNETPVTNVATGGFHAYKLPWGLELNFAIKSSHA